MKSAFLIFVTLILLAGFFLGADSVYAQKNLTLAEFKHMPGVEVFLEPDILSTHVYVELSDHANYLGEDFKALGTYTITASIVVCDSEMHRLVEAPLQMQHINSGGTRSEKPKSNFTLIEFQIDSKLLPYAAFDFRVQPMRGGFDVGVRFGAQDIPR